MSKISIFNSPYQSKAISKHNANSAGWSDLYAPNTELANYFECPICNKSVKKASKT